ncbi:hypothetical protein [Actinomadura sp. 7K507]|uniref:hypothetical protein n=1 Tax=Actinomadura sp. 7K507 TaxID=2530365 RepID=UPI00104ECE6F|nr:hypothetical protein [Actinomadura sp. 7K507]TDC77440.1 hypothetical protein E1285_38690 [Actinomadura sp. 7K507]
MLPLDPCSPVTDPACVQPVDNDDSGNPLVPTMPDIGGMIGGKVLDEAAESFQAAVGWLISKTASWWVETPSPDLEDESAVGYLQLLVQPLTVAVAVMALLVVGARMALTHKATPLLDAGRGLVVLAAVTAIGVLVPNLLLQWGDEWCGWVLSASSQGDFAQRMTKIVTFPSGTPAALVLILCLFALLIGIIQALLLLFRGGALVILAGLLPLAAAGMITSSTKGWFPRVTGWMLALIFYKPAAAAVYATAFTLVGEGDGLHALLMGFAMMLISLIAFPVLLKFFTWTTGGTEASSGGGVLSALMGSATAIGTLRAYGAMSGSGGGQSGSAGEHADYLNQQLGDQDTPPPGDSQPGQPPTPPPGQEHGGQASTGTPGEQISDTGGPSGSGQAAAGQSGAGQSPQGGGGGWAPPDGGQGEPVAPTLIQTAEKQQQRGEDAVRWAATAGTGAPVGGGSGGGPTGAVGEGGGSGK